MELTELIKKKGRVKTAGLMTGTSMDGLDICVADIDLTENGLEYSVIYSEFISFPESIKSRIRDGLTGSTQEICALHYDLGRFYADELEKSLTSKGINSVELIGSHGQTLHHISGHSTLQIGEPSFLSERFNVPVVSDFRAGDIAAGGTGAPLIPAVDMWLFQHDKTGRCLLNIGGVANITLIPSDGSKLPVLGFDTGPGMGLLDEQYRQIFKGPYDKDGQVALSGHIHREILDEWEKHPFLLKNPPKSTGRDEFGVDWLNKHRKDLESMDPPSQLATLAVFTAETIAKSIIPYREAYHITELFTGGGGSRHSLIIKVLEEELPGMNIRSVRDCGVDPDSKEALGFAILACACIRRIPGNIPTVTGARRPVILGKISQPAM